MSTPYISLLPALWTSAIPTFGIPGPTQPYRRLFTVRQIRVVSCLSIMMARRPPSESDLPFLDTSCAQWWSDLTSLSLLRWYTIAADQAGT
ncbi:hypothetical protein C8R48DRAFT_733931 [Suillus tomentosus]|nr:hypothetical protein C8R48DRAFT_733931 [Suillus tomentosus]